MTTNQYGIEEVSGRFNPARGERKPSHFNVYEIATGKDIRKGLPSRDMAEAAIRALETPEQPQTQPAQTTAPTGWSKAAQARRGEPSHPLGDLIERQGGRSVYRDTTFGNGGRVEIWDNE